MLHTPTKKTMTSRISICDQAAVRKIHPLSDNCTSDQHAAVWRPPQRRRKSSTSLKEPRHLCYSNVLNVIKHHVQDSEQGPRRRERRWNTPRQTTPQKWNWIWCNYNKSKVSTQGEGRSGGWRKTHQLASTVAKHKTIMKTRSRIQWPVFHMFSLQRSLKPKTRDLIYLCA